MSIATELELIKLKLAQAEIMDAQVSDDALIVELMDGRTVSAPIMGFHVWHTAHPKNATTLKFSEIAFTGRI